MWPEPKDTFSKKLTLYCGHTEFLQTPSHSLNDRHWEEESSLSADIINSNSRHSITLDNIGYKLVIDDVTKVFKTTKRIGYIRK